ncbi:MAG: PqqD family protein [Acidobacteriota bacterium]
MIHLANALSVYRHAGEVVMRRVGREALLVPVRNRAGDLDSIFTLNETAILVWEALDGKTPLEAVVERICRDYDVDPDRAAADAGEIVGTLVEAGLLERSE